MDWITARRKCSIGHAWNILCEQIRTDIEIWRSGAGADITVELSVDANVAVVTKNSPRTDTVSITLRRKRHHIAVELPGSPGHRTSTILTPLVNEAGECRLSLAGTELEFWQASRSILEKFLFADGDV